MKTAPGCPLLSGSPRHCSIPARVKAATAGRRPQTKVRRQVGGRRTQKRFSCVKHKNITPRIFALAIGRTKTRSVYGIRGKRRQTSLRGRVPRDALAKSGVESPAAGSEGSRVSQKTCKHPEPGKPRKRRSDFGFANKCLV